jgi:MoxR-like ATPase
LNIPKTISLLPRTVVQAVLDQHGAKLSANCAFTGDPVTDDRWVIDLIQAGHVTIDQVRGTKPSAIAQVGLPDDIRKAVYDSQAKVDQALAQVETLRSSADRSLDSALQQSTQIAKDFKTLTERLNVKIDAVEKPDVKVIEDTIRTEVSKLFDSFRKTTPKEVIAKVAQSVPKVKRAKVKDVFDGALSYEYGGETIDFSNMDIELWGDPSAPARVDDYVFDPKHLHQALVALDDPLPDNVWLAGERGTGKTEFVTQVASRLGRKLFRVNFDEAMERAEFIGGNTIKDGNVVWKAGVITQAIQHTGALIILDEVGFARAQSIAVLHSLCERSPHRSIVIAETGERIAVASHVAFFCADNSNGFGDQSGNFAGVRDQNTAFIDRFGYTLRFEYLPFADEVSLVSKRTGLPVDASEVLVKFATVAREKAKAGVLTQPPSLRQLFAWARAITKGVPVGIAFENAIINKFPSDCEAELRGVFSATIDVNNLKSFLTK